MSLLFIEGFDHYTTPSQKWLASGSSTIAAGPARNGAGGITLGAGGNITKHFGGQYAEMIMGFAWKPNGAGSGQDICRFMDSSSIQMTVAENANGSYSIKRNATIINTSAIGLITLSAWHYIEFRVLFHGTAGSYVLKVNGVEIFNVTGVDTNQSANNFATGICLFAGGSSAFDDVYVLTTSGTYNNTFLGDVKVETLLPNGVGSFDDWSPVGAIANWSANDEAAPNSETDYSLGDLGDSLLFAMGNLAAVSGSIPGVQISAFARKDNAGFRSVKQLQKPSAGSAVQVSADIPLLDTYGYSPRIYDRSVAESNAAWTIAAVNGMQVGAEVTV